MNGRKLVPLALLLIAVLSFASFASAEYVKTTYEDGSLNVRKGPGTKYEVAGWVRNGQKITVLETDGAWTKIVVDATGKTGYIKSSYIERKKRRPMRVRCMPLARSKPNTRSRLSMCEKARERSTRLRFRFPAAQRCAFSAKAPTGI